MDGCICISGRFLNIRDPWPIHNLPLRCLINLDPDHILDPSKRQTSIPPPRRPTPRIGPEAGRRGGDDRGVGFGGGRWMGVFGGGGGVECGDDWEDWDDDEGDEDEKRDRSDDS